MEEAGNSDEEIETALEIMRPFMVPIYLFVSFLIPFIIGFVTSLIAAVPMKKERLIS